MSGEDADTRTDDCGKEFFHRRDRLSHQSLMFESGRGDDVNTNQNIQVGMKNMHQALG